jgi:hypothetical protein
LIIFNGAATNLVFGISQRVSGEESTPSKVNRLEIDEAKRFSDGVVAPNKDDVWAEDRDELPIQKSADPLIAPFKVEQSRCLFYPFHWGN